MEFDEAFHSFQFDDDPFFNQQINPVGPRQLDFSIGDVYRNLPLDSKSRLLEFIGQACFIGAFEQSRSKVTLDHDGAAQDHLGEASQFKFSAFLRHSACLRFHSFLFKGV